MSSRIKISFFSLCLIILLSPLFAARAESCRWVNIQTGLFCSTTIGNIEWQEKDSYFCSASEPLGPNAHCCCGPQETNANKTNSPKYIIIGSLIALFGGATVLILIFRKNELQ
jgi:hypothetical protein